MERSIPANLEIDRLRPGGSTIVCSRSVPIFPSTPNGQRLDALFSMQYDNPATSTDDGP